ncbi:hypothetical protein DH2020_002282 [Rehmannia glutinosa]|uniref:SET domain-containing protein n=1 Tax=Rehmannia glutinosa TaxID=99300 RepID=A0ABR0XT86_REHGL
MATGLDEAKLELFLQWLKVNGAELRGCKIKYCSSSKGFGIFSSNDVPDGVLLVVPLDLAITPMRVLEDPLIGPECRSMFEEGEVDDRFLIMLFLTVERLRKNSSWKPYLDMLPTEFGNPLWFTDDELIELKGTTLHRATELQKKNLKSLFDERVKKLAEKLLVLDGNPENEVRFEDFLWANSVFWTRALNIPLPHSYVFPRVQPEQDSTASNIPCASTNHVSTEELVNRENGKVLQINKSASHVSGVESTSQGETIWVEGLVPGIDFCNHDLKAAATWEVDGTGSTTGIPFSMYLLSAGNILLQGEKEISISYGSKGNEVSCLSGRGQSTCMCVHMHVYNNGYKAVYISRILFVLYYMAATSAPKELLYLYGFVVKDNPDDYLMIHYPTEAISDVSFSETKVQLLEAQLVGSEGGRQPSETEVRAAIWEACGDCGALQLLVDLLNMKMMELEEGSGTEENDADLLKKVHNSESAGNEKRSCSNGFNCRSMSRNRWASIVYRQGQKQLTRRFIMEAEHALQLALSECN